LGFYLTKLFYIQPLIPSYRIEVVRKLAECFRLSVLSGTPANNSGFSSIPVENLKFINCPHLSLFGGQIFWQRNVFSAFVSERPEIVLACANVRDITFWLLAIFSFFFRIKFYAHGQGGFSSTNKNFVFRLLYGLMFVFVDKYIAYTEFSRDSLLSIGLPKNKIVVADNSIEVQANAKFYIKSGKEPGVLFLGRLRHECKLEDLVSALDDLRTRYPDVVLHVVGGGELESEYRQRFDIPWVYFHGAVFDEDSILQISRDCRVGCYPGDAGLSVVHYFALRLPSIVHDEITSHMGPEPSYVIDGKNGIFFSRKERSAGVLKALEKLWMLPDKDYQAMSRESFAKYERLNSPSLGEKIVSILRG